MSDKNYLGASWVRFQSVPKGSAEYLELEWVVEQMWDLCGSEREKAWNAIQEIIALDQSDNTLAMVGAGPFENLMVHHGPLLIERVEVCARVSPPFRRMLGVVWRNRMSEQVWTRLKAIAPPSW